MQGWVLEHQQPSFDIMLWHPLMYAVDSCTACALAYEEAHVPADVLVLTQGQNTPKYEDVVHRLNTQLGQHHPMDR